jgi:nitrogen regulatory protein PII
MKLLLITTIAAFTDEVKQILKKAQVSTYSYKEVMGYKSSADASLETNWFGSELQETESVIFYAFVPKERTESVCDAVAAFNSEQETMTHMHVAVLAIEKTNN